MPDNYVDIYEGELNIAFCRQYFTDKSIKTQFLVGQTFKNTILQIPQVKKPFLYILITISISKSIQELNPNTVHKKELSVKESRKQMISIE